MRRTICLLPARTAPWLIKWGVIVGWWFWGGWLMSLIAACVVGLGRHSKGDWTWTLDFHPALTQEPSQLGWSSCSLSQEQPLLRSQCCSYLSLNGVISLRDSPSSLCIKSAVQKTKALISEAWRCLSELQVPFLAEYENKSCKIRSFCWSWKVGGGLLIIEGGRTKLLDLKHKHIVFLAIRKSIFIALFPQLICLGGSSYFWDNKLFFTLASSL